MCHYVVFNISVYRKSFVNVNYIKHIRVRQNI